MALGEVKRRQGLFCRVLAPERLEARIVERLHPERQPVDAGRAVAGEALRFHARGICFERDLGIAVEPPMPGDGVEDRRHRRGLHQRRRAAAEEHACDAPSRRKRSEIGKLGEVG